MKNKHRTKVLKYLLEMKVWSSQSGNFKICFNSFLFISNFVLLLKLNHFALIFTSPHLKVYSEEPSCNILLQSLSSLSRGKNFSLRQNMLTVPEIDPNCYSTGIRSYVLGGTVVVHKVDHSPPFSPEVRNTWNYTSTPNVPSWRPYGEIYYICSPTRYTEFFNEWVYSSRMLARHVSDLTGPSSGAFCTSCICRFGMW